MGKSFPCTNPRKNQGKPKKNQEKQKKNKEKHIFPYFFSVLTPDFDAETGQATEGMLRMQSHDPMIAIYSNGRQRTTLATVEVVDLEVDHSRSSTLEVVVELVIVIGNR